MTKTKKNKKTTPAALCLSLLVDACSGHPGPS